MARPRYIICAKDRLVDQASGLASHINVIDRLTIGHLKPPSVPDGVKLAILQQPIVQMVLTAVWIKDDNDSESDEFEYETIIRKPNAEPLISHTGEFRFLKRYYRIDSGITFTTGTQFPSSGEMILENRIRKRGTTDWLAQAFSFELEVNRQSEPSPLSDDPAECANQS